jgi:hypothetical protein
MLKKMIKYIILRPAVARRTGDVSNGQIVSRTLAQNRAVADVVRL